MTSAVPPPARTSPPLSAVPGGVTSFQRVLPAGRMNSCQKLLSWAADPPITTAAQVPAAVSSEVFSDGEGGAACVAGAGVAGAPAHPAASMTAGSSTRWRRRCGGLACS